MYNENMVLIDLEAILHNYRLQKSLLPENVRIMAVIKANAYGHGIIEVAKALSSIGAADFAVARVSEGVELRLSGIGGNILSLGAATPSYSESAVKYSIAQTVFTPAQVFDLERAAVSAGKTVPVHIKLDTGMNRIGLRSEQEAVQLADALKECTHVIPEGVFTHFAVADETDEDGIINAFTKQQLQRFRKLRSYFDPSIPAHVSNSAMILLDGASGFDMVRQGISLYGYPPVPVRFPFKPALTWKTEVVHVKSVPAGETIGYGRTYICERDMRIATVAVGYGDGYHRALSGKGCMLIHGKRVPIVGRVCMDQTMVDVTGVPDVSVGDEVILIGRQGEEFLSAEEVAAWAGTISYEVLLDATSRVSRVYRSITEEK